ncbi:MAG: SDR family oxidoreductase [Syntrophales bacterium]|nr:SDR family oxidoreductase [Syntrophales bacterium]
MEISGKKAIITGGARGMGKQFACDLKESGADVFVIDVMEDALNTLQQDRGIPGAVLDVTSEEAVESFFHHYAGDHGAPDILINNAGITSDAMLVTKSGDRIRKFPLSSWNRVIQVNLTGVFLCGREAAAHMVKHGTKGLIINISSISRSGNRWQSNYSASKAGVASMTVTWAKELAPYGIRVAAIAPGFIKTDMVAKMSQKVINEIIGQIPLGRLGEMKEISQAVRFIIECDFVNGRVIEVDGGQRI